MRLGQSMSVESLGKLVLLIIIAVAIILFVVVGMSGQVSSFEQTGSNVVSNLTDKASDVSSGVVIG